jgi:hypothetical protein
LELELKSEKENAEIRIDNPEVIIHYILRIIKILLMPNGTLYMKN